MAEIFGHPFLHALVPMIAQRQNVTLKCRKKNLPLGTCTQLMGILNITPDSFADGGHYFDPQKALDHAHAMIASGAHIIDIGGESSRPTGPYGKGADPISVAEELRRTIPIITTLAKKIDVPISIDTTKAEVARRAIDAGADIINDISAMRFDANMAQVVAQNQVPIILMHMQGTPQTMQIKPTYHDLIGEITSFFKSQIERACHAGISQQQIVIDPGLGFGKTYDHNATIIAQLSAFAHLNCPLLLGPSRKKFTAPNDPPANRLPGTLAALSLCIMAGAHIVRVHDVAEAHQAISLCDRVRKTMSPP